MSKKKTDLLIRNKYQNKRTVSGVRCVEKMQCSELIGIEEDTNLLLKLSSWKH